MEGLANGVDSLPRISVRPVHPYAEIWEDPRVQKLVERGLRENGDLESAEDLLESLAIGRCQLWLVLHDGDVQALAVTAVYAHPARKVAEIIMLAGDNIEAWAPRLLEQIEAWARSQGCSWLQPIGRRGFATLAKRLGLKPVATIYRKVL